MNNFAKSALSCALLCMLAPLGSSYAEDTDIYATAQSGSNPNVLIVLDNSANWSAANQGWPGGIKQGQAELNAIRVVAGEQGDGLNLGLMIGTATGELGGYVRFKIRPMSFENKDALQHLIGAPSCTDATNALNDTPDCIYGNFNGSEKVNSVDYSKMMFEVFKYFGGYTNPANARLSPPVAGSPATYADALFGPYRYAGLDEKTDKYAFKNYATDDQLKEYDPPIGATSCAKNYVILIGNGFPGTDAESSFGFTKLTELGGDTEQLALNNINQTSGEVTTTTLLETTACGRYATTAECESDAAARFGTGTGITYNCTVASTCVAGGDPIVTNLGQTLTATDPSTGAVLGCNYYATAAACSSGIPQIFTGYDSYFCTSSATTCTTWVGTDSTNQYAANPTGCITDGLNSPNACTSYGNSNYPDYQSFNCTKTTVTPACGKIGNQNTDAWVITATEIKVAGTNFDISASKAAPAEGTADSHNIYKTVTSTVDTNVSTGTTSLPTNSNRNYADEWARFLNRTDVNVADGFQNLVIFTIDVYKDQPDAKQSALLMSMAFNGGGKYFVATDEDSIKNALRTIMSEIQAVNSVFASSSLPVSVNTQGTYLNQVFMGMFRPDSTGAPRWPGNIKQYKFKYFGSVLRLADANDNQAISTTTGFVTPCAVSYWSSDTGQYWDFPAAQAVGDCTAMTSAFPSAGSTSIFSDAPDGEVVEKGGAAQRLRGVKSSGGVLTSASQNYQVCTGTNTPENSQCRKLFTCDPGTCSSAPALVSFDTGNTALTATALTATALNCSGTCVLNDLINWVRGQDVDNENANAITNEMRPSVHGGVVHSHPAVVDYGGTEGVVAYYGSDDGVFHAVRGNQGATDGTELWSFIAPEHWAQQNRLRENGENGTSFIDFPDSTTTPVAPKDYGFDGGISVYQDAGSSTVWIFSAMRRGGRAIYAFDVSTPTSPTLKWRKGCFTNDTASDESCDTDWGDIGQTWSEPVVTYIAGSTSPVLIFGGGYDKCEDVAATSRCSSATLAPTPARKGSNIWIVDANTGTLIRKYSTYFSVPGDVTVLEDSTTGYATYIYAADTGGHVYRLKVGNYDGTTLSESWSGGGGDDGVSINDPSSILIASLSSTANHERKFMSGPSVQRDVGYNAVLVGSGDREAPMFEDYACNEGTGGVTNQFYMIIDRPALTPQPAAATVDDLVDVTAAGATFNAATFTVTDNTGSLDTTPTRHSSDRGWRFDFKSCEQSVNKSVVVAGVTFFGTNTPSASTEVCQINLGKAEGYAVDFQTGNPVMYDTETGNLVNDVSGARIDRSVPFIGGGMPPSPVAGVVDIDGKNTPFCIGCIDPTSLSTSALEGGKVNVNPVGSRLRSYWYIETD